MIVAPEREVPGMSEKHCANPTLSASGQRISSTDVMRGAPWRAYQRSTAKIAIAPTTSAIATLTGLKRKALISRWKARPTSAAGRNATSEVRREPLLHRVARDAGEGAGEARAVFPADGEDRAQLDHDVEDLALLVVHAEEVGDDDEVAGGGDGKELGEAFHHAQDERVQERGDFHRRESSIARGSENGGRGPPLPVSAGARPGWTSTLPFMPGCRPQM